MTTRSHRPTRPAPTLSARVRHAIRHSRLFLCIVETDSVIDAQTEAHAAYAQACGRPVCVLLAQGVQLPETAFQDITDLHVARSQGSEEDAAQIRTWLEALA